MTAKRKFRFDFWSVVTLVMILVFALFLVYPLFSLFISGFRDSKTNAFTMDNFVKFFQRNIITGH